MKFGEMLIEEGAITREHLKLSLERQAMFGGRLGTNLIELGVVKEDHLTNLLGKYLKVSSVDSKRLENIAQDAVDAITPDMADQYKIMPFKKERKRLHVAMTDVLNITMIDELRFKTGFDIIPYVASELRLLYALEKYYGIKRDLRFISVLDSLQLEEKKEKLDESEELKGLKEAFISIKDKDEIGDILINEATKTSSRSAIFVIKGDRLEGWKSQGIGIDGFSSEIDTNSVIAEVLAKKSFYRGPMFDSPANKAFIELLDGASPDCVLIPVSVRERIVAILYADGGKDGALHIDMNYLNGLALLASLSFEILILKNRILDFHLSSK